MTEQHPQFIPPRVPTIRQPDLFKRIGGRKAIERIVDSFYAKIETDKELRPLFPNNLEAGRTKQKLFLEQWLGGETRYSDQYGHPRLRRRHFPFVISHRAAGRWMRHMTQAFRDCGIGEDEVSELVATFGPMAKHMVNNDDNVPREPLEDTFLS